MNDDSIGIDISKDKLDCHRLSAGAFAQFPNTKSGFQKLRRWIGPERPARVVYEPTGPYHGAFEAALADHLPLVKVNPKHARRFAESKGQQYQAQGPVLRRWRSAERSPRDSAHCRVVETAPGTLGHT